VSNSQTMDVTRLTFCYIFNIAFVAKAPMNVSVRFCKTASRKAGSRRQRYVALQGQMRTYCVNFHVVGLASVASAMMMPDADADSMKRS
jgi:hypothetical protein